MGIGRITLIPKHHNSWNYTRRLIATPFSNPSNARPSTYSATQAMKPTPLRRRRKTELADGQMISRRGASYRDDFPIFIVTMILANFRFAILARRVILDADQITEFK